MIDRETLTKMKAQGAWIVSLATWKKWMQDGTARIIGHTKECCGNTVFDVKGKIVKNDWLLTYAHAQYEHLIPVNIMDVEADNTEED